MQAEESRKYFLDTSVARAILLGNPRYRQYFKSQFGDRPVFISRYVQMEFIRSYLRNVIAFYFTLDLQTVETVSDAIELWSNKFRGSEQTAILQLVAQLLRAGELDEGRPRDKRRAQQKIAHYIIRLDLKLRRMFRDTGVAIGIAISLSDLPRDSKNSSEHSMMSLAAGASVILTACC